MASSFSLSACSLEVSPLSPFNWPLPTVSSNRYEEANNNRETALFAKLGYDEEKEVAIDEEKKDPELVEVDGDEIEEVTKTNDEHKEEEEEVVAKTDYENSKEVVSHLRGVAKTNNEHKEEEVVVVAETDYENPKEVTEIDDKDPEEPEDDDEEEEVANEDDNVNDEDNEDDEGSDGEEHLEVEYGGSSSDGETDPNYTGYSYSSNDDDADDLLPSKRLKIE
ncbi:uncharacterized protein LOC133914893 [Phragmites australis]|uniref:uncharacterized protein LOC133914893 n=1 Tax=Phragmites australis TaxID=29695 RepID=UPI002D77F551|nr:uncharacterized protein LOC133914893 [Phragmites australis]